MMFPWKKRNQSYPRLSPLSFPQLRAKTPITRESRKRGLVGEKERRNLAIQKTILCARCSLISSMDSFIRFICSFKTNL